MIFCIYNVHGIVKARSISDFQKWLLQRFECEYDFVSHSEKKISGFKDFAFFYDSDNEFDVWLKYDGRLIRDVPFVSLKS